MPYLGPTYTPKDIDDLIWVRSQYRDIYARLQAAVQKHNLASPDEPQFLDKLVVDALDRLIAENAALRGDKERLDRLEKHMNNLSASGYSADDRCFSLLYCDGNKVDGSSVRETIDSADMLGESEDATEDAARKETR